MSVNMAQALESIYSDLEGVLVGMTPTAKTEHSFARRRPDDEQLRALKDSPGRPRLFEIAESEMRIRRHLYTGAGYSGIEISVPVDIMYPTHDGGDDASWHAAAFSDWFQFCHLLIDSTSIVGDGIQARMAWDGPEVIELAEDPWFVLRITVTALLHVAQ